RSPRLSACTGPIPRCAVSAFTCSTLKRFSQRYLLGCAKLESRQAVGSSARRYSASESGPGSPSVGPITSGLPRRLGLGGPPQTTSLSSVWPPQTALYPESPSRPSAEKSPSPRVASTAAVVLAASPVRPLYTAQCCSEHSRKGSARCLMPTFASTSPRA